MSITVKVAKLGGIVKEVLIDNDSTVDTATNAAEVDIEGQEVKVNGRTHDADFRVKNGDIITLAPKVKGGSY